MPYRTVPPDMWFAQIFASKAAARGGVVRRAIGDVERVMGRAEFEQRVRQRGFQLLQNGDQYIVLCNQQPVKLLR